MSNGVGLPFKSQCSSALATTAGSCLQVKIVGATIGLIDGGDILEQRNVAVPTEYPGNKKYRGVSLRKAR
jgi:hypothetical protein